MRREPGDASHALSQRGSQPHPWTRLGFKSCPHPFIYRIKLPCILHILENISIYLRTMPASALPLVPTQLPWSASKARQFAPTKSPVNRSRGVRLSGTFGTCEGFAKEKGETCRKRVFFERNLEVKDAPKFSPHWAAHKHLFTPPTEASNA